MLVPCEISHVVLSCSILICHRLLVASSKKVFEISLTFETEFTTSKFLQPLRSMRSLTLPFKTIGVNGPHQSFLSFECAVLLFYTGVFRALSWFSWSFLFYSILILELCSSTEEIAFSFMHSSAILLKMFALAEYVSVPGGCSVYFEWFYSDRFRKVSSF